MRTTVYYLLSDKNDKYEFYNSDEIDKTQLSPVEFDRTSDIKFLTKSIKEYCEFYQVDFTGEDNVEVLLIRLFCDSPYACTILAVSSDSPDDWQRFAQAQCVKEQLNINKSQTYSNVIAKSLYTKEQNKGDADDEISRQLRGSTTLRTDVGLDKGNYRFIEDYGGFAFVVNAEGHSQENNYKRLIFLQALLAGYQIVLDKTSVQLAKAINNQDTNVEGLQDLQKTFLLFNARCFSVMPINYQSTFLGECWQRMMQKQSLKERHKETLWQVTELSQFLLAEHNKNQQVAFLRKVREDEIAQKKQEQLINKWGVVLSIIGAIIGALQLFV